MILILWLILLVLSATIIFLGYYSEEEPYLPVGLFFLFLLGMVVLTGNLTYETGATLTATYNYTSNTLTSSTNAITYQNTIWNDQNAHWFGWSLSILSALAFGLSLFNLRRGEGDGYLA